MDYGASRCWCRSAGARMETLALVATVAGIGLLIRQMRQIEPEPVEPSEQTPYWGPTSFDRDVIAMGQAIAYAEGFYVQGSAPQRAHNPGAIKVPGWKGPVTGSEGISVFTSDDEGWYALRRQIDLIADGRSNVYSLGMTIDEMARRWTATDQSAWSSNVARSLGVSTNTKLSQVLA